MDENPSRISRNDRSSEGSRCIVTRNRRFPVEDTGAGDAIDCCSGKYCRSYTAVLLADCVAICCCPCAVVDLFVLTFVKLPCMVGRRCLRLVKRKRRERVSVNVIERDGNERKEMAVVEGKLEIPSGFVESEQMGNFCARFEAEKVWLEMYQLGHLGFGRFSCSGTQWKGN